MIKKIKKQKKGVLHSTKAVSIIIGYVLLVAAAVVMGAITYKWMKSYVPKDSTACPDGVSIFIKEYTYNSTHLNITLKNNGRFDIGGYFIHATNDSSQEIATIDLSQNLTHGGIILGNAVVFSHDKENLMEPNDYVTSIFRLDNNISSVEIIPIRFQEEDNKIRLASCGKSTTTETLVYEEGQCVAGGGIDENVVFLSHLDADASDSQHTYTVNGDPKLDAVTKQVGSGSIYFDGTGDYVSIPNSADWNFGSDDFTIDFWLRFTDISTSRVLFDTGYNNSTGILAQWNINSGGYIELYILGSTETPHFSWAPLTNTWYHLAITRSGNNLRCFVNGSQIGSTEESTANIEANYVLVGRRNIDTNIMMCGYIDEFRVSKGIARWTSDFSSSLPSEHIPDSNTKLLLHFDSDESNSDHTITFNGDIDVGSTQEKWDGSFYFDGTGDYLSISDSTDWDIVNKNFTIDFWFYRIGTNCNFGGQKETDTSFGWRLECGPTGFSFHIRDSTKDSGDLSFATTIDTGNWHHLALVHDGGNLHGFLDGVLVDTKTLNDIYDTFDGELRLGISPRMDNGNWYNPATTYMEEVRISNTARWTEDFSAELPNEPYT